MDIKKIITLWEKITDYTRLSDNYWDYNSWDGEFSFISDVLAWYDLRDGTYSLWIRIDYEYPEVVLQYINNDIWEKVDASFSCGNDSIKSIYDGLQENEQITLYNNLLLVEQIKTIRSSGIEVVWVKKILCMNDEKIGSFCNFDILFYFNTEIYNSIREDFISRFIKRLWSSYTNNKYQKLEDEIRSYILDEKKIQDNWEAVIFDDFSIYTKEQLKTIFQILMIKGEITIDTFTSLNEIKIHLLGSFTPKWDKRYKFKKEKSVEPSKIKISYEWSIKYAGEEIIHLTPAEKRVLKIIDQYSKGWWIIADNLLNLTSITSIWSVKDHIKSLRRKLRESKIWDYLTIELSNGAYRIVKGV
jgi:hypothetical protein